MAKLLILLQISFSKMTINFLIVAITRNIVYNVIKKYRQMNPTSESIVLKINIILPFS